MTLLRRHLTIALVALTLSGTFVSIPARAGQWDDLGDEFCRLTQAGDMTAMRNILSASLMALIQRAAANPEMPPARTLFQTYSNEVSQCSAKTRSLAIVDIRRQNPSGAPSWTDQLVVTPEMDGTSRIDDVLFAVRRSDTLRSRLNAYAGIR